MKIVVKRGRVMQAADLGFRARRRVKDYTTIFTTALVISANRQDRCMR